MLPWLLLLLAPMENPDLKSLIAAEKAFAALSEQRGTKTAFLANLAEEAILFRPRPVPGRAWIEQRPESPGTLHWRPVVAVVSGAGDLGYTTGPYELRLTDKINHGHFVSIWRRRPDGVWRVLLDTGTPHGPPPAAELEVERGTAEFARRPREDPVGMEAGLPTEATSQEWAAILSSRASKRIRTYRSSSFPSSGREALNNALRTRQGRIRYERAGAHESSSQDLGYCYGTASLRPYRQGGQILETWCYLRIWSRLDSPHWNLVLDLESPIPAGK